MKLIKSILGAGALLLAASSQATVIASDDFAVDGPLDGSTGGIGFTNAWSGGTYTINTGLVSGTGNSLRSLASTLGSSGTLWVSFDMARTAGDSYGGLSFFEESTERLIIGDWFKKGVWGLDAKNGQRPITDISIDGIKTAVAKITLGAGATSAVELWVGENDTDPVDCSGLADASVTSVNLENAGILRIGSGFTMDFADLIIADSAAEVGAIVGGGSSYAAYTTGSWANDANWSDGVPTASDDAILDLGADVTLDAVESVQTLSVKTAASLTIADGAQLTVSSNVTFASGTTLTIGIGSGSNGKLVAGDLLTLGGTSLELDGGLDGDSRIIAVATNGLAGEFSNYADEALVQRSSGINYYISYVTSAIPNYVEINTNGAQWGEIVLPPRPTEQLIVDGFDQRYMAYDYDVTSGVWTDSVTSAQNATAGNLAGFSITTNTPNGRPAVLNSNDGLQMTFTRSSALSSTGFTIQAVIRLDAGNTDSRQGPFGLAEAGGWGGLFMGVRAGDTSKVRAGNLGNTGSGTTVLQAEAANTLSTNVWGVYTLTVDPMVTTQMVARLDLLSDGSEGFSITHSVAGATNWVGAIGTAGGLFAGERGGGLAASDNWQGAIADLVVYNRVLDDSEIVANQVAFQSIYKDPIVYPTSIGDVSIAVLPGGSNVVISWATSEYGTFALEATPSLTIPSWGDVETGIPATGGDVSVTTTVSDAASFYRAYLED
jgi:hypothetical protein